MSPLLKSNPGLLQKDDVAMGLSLFTPEFVKNLRERADEKRVGFSTTAFQGFRGTIPTSPLRSLT